MPFSGRTEEFLDTEVQNDGFFPDLILGDLQEDYRIPTKYQTETIIHHLKVAMDEVNQDLEPLKLDSTTQGITALENLNSIALAGEPVPIIRYKRAVFSKTKALLTQQFASMDRRESAARVLDDLEEERMLWMAESRKAVNLLLGKATKITAELL